MASDYYAGALGDLGGFDEILFERALDQWTERPQLGGGFDRRTLKLYDALIWTRIENIRDEFELTKSSIDNRNKTRNNNSHFVKCLVPKTNDDLISRLDEINRDIDGWKYTGKVYRVIDCKKDQVEYHDLIASWVYTPKAFKNFNHLYENHSYTFLIGETHGDWAFNVNKYRVHINCSHPYTEYECEIILPMNKKYVTDVFYGTLNDFYAYIKYRTK